MLVYTDKPFVCITHIHTKHRIIKIGGGHLLTYNVHGDGAYSGEYSMYMYMHRTVLYMCCLFLGVYIHVDTEGAADDTAGQVQGSDG